MMAVFAELLIKKGKVNGLEQRLIQRGQTNTQILLLLKACLGASVDWYSRMEHFNLQRMKRIDMSAP
jgi:hypothetical protein